MSIYCQATACGKWPVTRQRITRLSKTDELTGLLNMRAYNDILKREIARVMRYAQPFSVIMVDVDSLKSDNDRYGHTTGSRLIKAIAESIIESARNTDVLARFGGDVFVILMTHTSTEQAQMAAERIRAAVHNTSLDMKGNRISTTVNAGNASFPESVREAAEVLDKAGIALYRSKQRGSNRVTCYDPTLENFLPAPDLIRPFQQLPDRCIRAPVYS